MNLTGEYTLVASALDAMAVADEEMWTAGVFHVPGLFIALQRPVLMQELDIELYRAHARELCKRARRGEDLATGTRAEVLASLLACTVVMPAQALLGTLIDLLMFELVPGVAGRTGLSKPKWSGKWREEVEAMRLKISVPDRKLLEVKP